MPTRERRAKNLGVEATSLPDGRGKHKNHSRGHKHHRWSNEKVISEHGYVKVRVGVGHPLADPNGYAYEHAVVWVSAGNECPSGDLVLHHINEDKTDNRIENLKLMNRGRHAIEHHLDRQANGRFVGKKAAGRLLDGREWNECPKAGAS